LGAGQSEKMLYLLLSILCSAAVANLLMAFSRRAETDIFIVFLGNYIVAAIFSFLMIPGLKPAISAFDIGLGSVTGLLFLGSFLLYRRNIGLNGMSLSVGVMRTAVIIPVAVSVLLFSDRVFAVQGAGIVIIILAFILLNRAGKISSLALLAALFLVSGLTESSLKVYSEMGSGHNAFYIFTIFGTAALLTLGWILITGRKFSGRLLFYGFILGVPNQLSTVFFLKGLGTVNAVIAYPLAASGVVIVCMLADFVLWKKKFSLREGVLYGAIIAGIILLNLT